MPTRSVVFALSKRGPIQRLKTLPQSIRLHTHQPFEEIEAVRPGFREPMQRECNIRQISRDERCRRANVAQGRSSPTSQGIRDRMYQKRIPPFAQKPFQPPDQKLLPSTRNQWLIQNKLPGVSRVWSSGGNGSVFKKIDPNASATGPSAAEARRTRERSGQCAQLRFTPRP